MNFLSPVACFVAFVLGFFVGFAQFGHLFHQPCLSQRRAFERQSKFTSKTFEKAFLRALHYISFGI